MIIELPGLMWNCLRTVLSLVAFVVFPPLLHAQNNAQASTQYQNPVIHADYSDPDAIRVGNHYYMVASSFNSVPGLPILESTDLVNWRLISYALPRLVPEQHYQAVQPGGGVWAPSIRFHNGTYYIFYPDPDFGIYRISAKNIRGPWSSPLLVQAGKGLIDPCPLWDTDGKVYMVYAFAGSRAGIKSILTVIELDATASRPVSKPVLVYDGHADDPTVEGPKFYKQNGYYYIFAPAGGVATGWQIVLRSKNVYGPYERKVVMAQEKSAVNGPHQGAWIKTPSGENWFLHFQDKEAYGRVVHLQPMKWINDWPLIGIDPDGNGIGEPVTTFRMPGTAKAATIKAIEASDEFNSVVPGLQWQWQANPAATWAFTTPLGYLAMPAVYQPDTLGVFLLPSVLSQKFPAESFTATVLVNFLPRHDGETFRYIVHGTDYAYVSVKRNGEKLQLSHTVCFNADKRGREETGSTIEIPKGPLYLRIDVKEGGICTFSYSITNNKFTTIGNNFIAKPGKWVGAKIGMSCTGTKITNDAGWAQIDWIRFTSNNQRL